jgi:hypothetical protein
VQAVDEHAARGRGSFPNSCRHRDASAAFPRPRAGKCNGMARSHSIAELKELQQHARQTPLEVDDADAPELLHDAAIDCERVIAVHADAILYLAPGGRARTAFLLRSEGDVVVIQDRPGFQAEL